MMKSEPVLESEKPRVLADNSALEANWVDGDEGKEDNWRSKGSRNGRRRQDEGEEESRSFSDGFGHLLILLLLLGELTLWILVGVSWRSSHLGSRVPYILLPCFLSSLILPALCVLHSLFKGKLSYKMALLLIVPPSPIILHLLLAYRCLAGSERSRLSRYGRSAGQVQALIMSAPLTILSLLTLITAAVEETSVDVGNLHRHMYENNLQLAAATLSLVNLVMASYRYNERVSGNPVGLLVGLPFILTSLSFRLVGLAVLFSFYDTAWICLSLGLLLSISCLSVQLASNFTLCGQLCRKLFGDFGGNREKPESHVSSSLLLSLGGVLLPCGYNRDRQLGHSSGRGWRLIFLNWFGNLLVLSLVLSHAMSQYIPNTYTGLSSVNMQMVLPKTDITVRTGGTHLELQLPETFMSMLAGSPVKATISTSNHQDMILSIMLPVLLALLTLPFTILRIILLGWNCRLSPMEEEGLETDSGEELALSDTKEARRPSHSRNCCTVTWSLASMMAFTASLGIILMVYVFCLYNSVNAPHEMGE